MSYTELGYTPGWCGQCGRRLGRDNRCGNCDPWWTSPVFQYTGGFAVLAAVVVLGINAFSHSSSPLLTDGGGSNSAAPQYLPSTAPATNTYGSAYNGSASTGSGERAYLPVAMVSASGGSVRGTSTVNPDEVKFAQLVELRQMTAYVDSVVNASRIRRYDNGDASGFGARQAGTMVVSEVQ